MIDVHTHLWDPAISPQYMADYFQKKKEAGKEICMTAEELPCSHGSQWNSKSNCFDFGISFNDDKPGTENSPFVYS